MRTPIAPAVEGRGGFWYAYGGNQEDPDWEDCTCLGYWRVPLIPQAVADRWRRRFGSSGWSRWPSDGEPPF